jgi:hypothetical protein
MDATGSSDLQQDLDLILTAPSGKIYRGNVFRETTSTDCPTGPPGQLEASPWSLPNCPASLHDTKNPVEAIFISPDPSGNGVFNDPDTAVDEAADNAVEPGGWTLTVSGANSLAPGQPFAVVAVGGICATSGVSLDKAIYGPTTTSSSPYPSPTSRPTSQAA